jgi:hypothetical protein
MCGDMPGRTQGRCDVTIFGNSVNTVAALPFDRHSVFYVMAAAQSPWRSGGVDDPRTPDGPPHSYRAILSIVTDLFYRSSSHPVTGHR